MLRRRRVLAIVGGSLILVVGIVLAVGACGELALGSDCETDNTADVRLSSTTPAIAVFSTALEWETTSGGFFCEGHDRLELRAEATPTAEKELFLGLAPVTTVVDYLDAVEHDRAHVELVLADVSYRRKAGRTASKSFERPPAEQSFWSARAVESERTVALDVTRPIPGHYAVVLANADGSPGVSAETSWLLTSSTTTDPVPVLLLLLGIAALVLGAVVIVRGGRGQAARGNSSEVPASSALNASDS